MAQIPPIIREPRRGHQDLLVREVEKHCNIRHIFFSKRLVNPWNSLPVEVVETKSLNSFKSKLEKFMVTNRFITKNS